MKKVNLKDLKIQARIIKDNSGFYLGEVFKPEMIDDKKLLNYLNANLKDGWNTVTNQCFTKMGCRQELRRWKKAHFIDTFEL